MASSRRGRPVRRVGVGASKRPPHGDRFVGVPGMSALGNHLARGSGSSSSIAAIEPVGAGGSRTPTAPTGAERGGRGPAPGGPPPRGATGPGGGRVGSDDGPVPRPDGLDPPLAVPFDAARVREADARRGIGARAARWDHWVAHLHPEAAARHLEAPPEEQLELLLAAFGAALGVTSRRSAVATAGATPARPRTPSTGRCAFDPDAGLGLCGDWLVVAVEAAWRSGAALAGQVLGALGAHADRPS